MLDNSNALTLLKLQAIVWKPVDNCIIYHTVTKAFALKASCFLSGLSSNWSGISQPFPVVSPLRRTFHLLVAPSLLNVVQH